MDNMISVIVTTYNRVNYLNECISSIKKQTYKNIKIIVVDDGPSDITEEMIRDMQIYDDRIKYIKHSINKGSGAAKNTGIEAATGEYITFVDSDDKLANIYAYEKALKIFGKSNIDVYAYDETNEENIMITKKYKKYRINATNIYKPTTMLQLKIFKAKQIKKLEIMKELNMMIYHFG